MSTEAQPKTRKLKRLEGIEYIDITLIQVNRETRARRSYKEVMANANIIAASLVLVGPISPLVLDEENNLIAGECRYEAYRLCGQTEVPYVIRSKLTPTQQRMLELDENNSRAGMHWADKALAIREVHLSNTAEAFNKRKEEWTTRASGQLVGQSHTYVADCVKIAEYIAKGSIAIHKHHLVPPLVVLPGMLGHRTPCFPGCRQGILIGQRHQVKFEARNAY